MDNGWIKIHRSILDWEWYSDIKVRLLWYHLLLIANYKDKQWRGRTIQVGQIATSLEHLSVGAGLSVQETRTALGKLESTNDIIKESTNGFTVITICKYAFYQGCESEEQQTNNKPATNQQQTDNKPLTTTKEYKEINNINSVCDNARGFFEIASQDMAWLEIMCMQTHNSLDQVQKWLQEFDLHQKAGGEKYYNVNEYKKHFRDWVKYRVNDKQKTQGNEANKDRRRNFETTATTADDYYKSF